VLVNARRGEVGSATARRFVESLIWSAHQPLLFWSVLPPFLATAVCAAWAPGQRWRNSKH